LSDVVDGRSILPSDPIDGQPATVGLRAQRRNADAEYLRRLGKRDRHVVALTVA
jgi:hypothetical protein